MLKMHFLWPKKILLEEMESFLLMDLRTAVETILSFAVKMTLY